MIKSSKLVTRYIIAAAFAGSFCLANQSFSQAAKVDEGPPKGTSSMAGVGQKPRKSAAKSTTAPAAGEMMAGAAMSPMDKQFMDMAGKDGMKEVHMGQMAVKDGQSADIKKLGSMIVADHTKANNQLMEIATKRGVKLDVRHSMNSMSKKDMANFDQAWLGMMVNDHQKDIASFANQAKMGTDPELKAFAKKTLPVLQKHLKAVQAAQKKMGSSAMVPKDPGATTAKAGQ